MIIYLKNMAGYKMKHFRGMTYEKLKLMLFKDLKKMHQGINDAASSITVAGSRLMLLGKVDTAVEVIEEFTLSGEIMPQLNQIDYKHTKAYLPRIHRSKAMDEEVREFYRHLEGRLLFVSLALSMTLLERTSPFLKPLKPNFKRNTNKLHIDDLRPKLRGWEFFLKENFFCTIGNRDHVNACTTYMLYYLTIKRKFNFTSMILYRMDEVKKNNNAPMSFVMLLTRLYKHLLQTNPQAIVPLD
nr:hypothetical protein [Tanacetum cinerariifolium]